MHMNQWFEVSNICEIDSPSLFIYEDRVLHNIDTAINMVQSINKLRPHVKTHKSAEIVKIFLSKGIHKFKCATIAEAEMLGMCNAQDVLLSYQPNGEKIKRLFNLVQQYPNTLFNCLVDSIDSATQIANYFSAHQMKINVFIDINNGMNRTGIRPNNKALELYKFCSITNGLEIKGLHVYDGHFRNLDIIDRKKEVDQAFLAVTDFVEKIKKENLPQPVIIVGGSPTFPIHATRTNVECSPGTFVYWDYGYATICKEQNFLPAAVLITRVISIIDENTICVDLGHKSVASENDLQKRIHFLNAEGLKPVSQSEEHLVLENTNNIPLKIGDVLYGLPYHICPTVALYDSVHVIKDNLAIDKWKNIARDRMITI